MAFLRRIFNKYPLVSNCTIYGSLYCAAEFSQQTVLRKIIPPENSPALPYDTDVLKNYAIVSTLGISPTLYYWYRFLDSKFVGTTARIVVRKCLMDQILMTPNLLVMFYVGMSVLEKKDDYFAELKAKFVPTYIANSLFWVPNQAANFSLIPPQFRIVYIGCCTLVWVNILCWFKRQEPEEKSSQ